MAKKREKIIHNSVSLINIYQTNFLAHSYIYYMLNDNVMSDAEYDRTCKRLVELMKDSPKLAKESEYYKLCKQLDESASGFYLQREDYPEEIVNIAKTLLNRKIEHVNIEEE